MVFPPSIVSSYFPIFLLSIHMASLSVFGGEGAGRWGRGGGGGHCLSIVDAPPSRIAQSQPRGG
jgi:hypothetical protein